MNLYTLKWPSEMKLGGIVVSR